MRAKSAHCTLFRGRKIRKRYGSADYLSGIQIAVPLSAQLTQTHRRHRVRVVRREAIMNRQEAETGSAASEYLTVPALAKMVRRNRRTLYGWIASGEIGDAEALFVVQRRFVIHLPTFRARRFKPLEELSRAGSTLETSAEALLPRRCHQINPTLTPPEPVRKRPERLAPDVRCQEKCRKLAEREGFEPSVPVTQYARLAMLLQSANAEAFARLCKTL